MLSKQIKYIYIFLFMFFLELFFINVCFNTHFKMKYRKRIILTDNSSMFLNHRYYSFKNELAQKKNDTYFHIKTA